MNITLRDDSIIQIDERHIKHITHITNLLESVSTDEEYADESTDPRLEVLAAAFEGDDEHRTPETIRRMIECLSTHLDDDVLSHTTIAGQPVHDCPVIPAPTPADMELCNALPDKELYALMCCSDYYGCNYVTVACAQAFHERHVKDKSIEYIREYFGQPNDLTPQEVEETHAENQYISTVK